MPTTEELIELGKRVQAKRDRKAARDAKAVKIAIRFVELLQEALEADKSCSIVVWAYQDKIDGEIFGVTRYNPCGRGCRIVEKRTGVTIGRKLAMKPEDRPDYYATSVDKDRATDPSHGTRFRVWPGVGAWEARIINRVVRERIRVPANRSMKLCFMDIRSVNGAYIEGPKE